MLRRGLFLVIVMLISVNSSAYDRVREFPANTIFASICKISYPNVLLQEIPSNWCSSLFGMMFLANQKVVMSPASILRDKSNTTHVQTYLDNLLDAPVAVQLDYQGRVWVIWQLSDYETRWVIKNKFNNWQKSNSINQN